jgi:hypothetical protein
VIFVSIPTALVLLALSLMAGAALGMEEEHATSAVTIKSPAPSTFKGRVSSEDASCIKGRTVKLLQKDPDGTKAISQGISDKNGVWRVALEGKLEGDFFAKVTQKRVSSVVCDKARSRTISL